MENSSLSDHSNLTNELVTVSDRLLHLYELAVHQFPYAEIRSIGKTVTSRKKLTRRLLKNDFIPNLAMYFSDISGASSWGMKAIEWSPEKRQTLTKYLSQGFFERFPCYVPLRRWISETSTPVLYKDFVLQEEMRINVLALIRLLDKLEGNDINGN